MVHLAFPCGGSGSSPRCRRVQPLSPSPSPSRRRPHISSSSSSSRRHCRPCHPRRHRLHAPRAPDATNGGNLLRLSLRRSLLPALPLVGWSPKRVLCRPEHGSQSTDLTNVALTSPIRHTARHGTDVVSRAAPTSLSLTRPHIGACPAHRPPARNPHSGSNQSHGRELSVRRSHHHGCASRRTLSISVEPRHLRTAIVRRRVSCKRPSDLSWRGSH